MSDAESMMAAFQKVPFNHHFQFALLERSAGAARVTAALRAEYAQEHGVAHGAIITAVADTAAVWLFHPELAAGEAMTSIEFKVNFLSAARLDRGALLAEATRVRRGRRIGVAQADVRQGDTHIARGMFTYLFFRPGGE